MPAAVTVFRAPWILPISQPPIREGWVSIADDRIVAVGAGRPPSDAIDVPGVILPGLVNAHIHLELSWMRGQVPPASSMPAWATRLIALRRTTDADPPAPMVEAIAELRAAGTVLVGDITNTLAAYGPLLDSDLSAAVFREVLGFAVQDPSDVMSATAAEIDALTPVAWLRPSIVPHAPYSVSVPLLRAIASADAARPISIHLAESLEELEFLRTGQGPWRALLDTIGSWNPSWTPPGSGSVDYIRSVGLVNDRLLAVHGVQLTNAELATLASVGATVVTCPRSNRWTGAGDPPIARFFDSGVRVAVGTDSLASVEDLNLFEELRVMRALAPGVPASAILASATQNGADALGFGDEFGTIEAGKRAELIAVDLPAAAVDVEEYLLSGITPGQVHWLRPPAS